MLQNYCVEDSQLVDVEFSAEVSNHEVESNESSFDESDGLSGNEKAETKFNIQVQEITSDQDTALVNQNTDQTKNGKPKKVKYLVPLLKIFVPQIIFWAAFFQRSSTFILQGAQMDCYISSLHLPPGK